MIFLYYAYSGTRSPHPHIVFNKANGLVATASLSSIWPGPLPLVDIPNWDDDVYLTGGGADASLGSRFTESEPYAWRVVFLLMLWPRSSPSHPTAPPCAPTSQLHCKRPFLHRLHIIHPSDRPRFAKLGSSWIPMVQGHSVTPPSTLHCSAFTIPTLDFDLPVVLFYFHHTYHSLTTTGGWSGDGTNNELFLTAHGNMGPFSDSSGRLGPDSHQDPKFQSVDNDLRDIEVMCQPGDITHHCQSLAKMKNGNIDTLPAPFWAPSQSQPTITLPPDSHNTDCMGLRYHLHWKRK
jgi:hypothetical protein